MNKVINFPNKIHNKEHIFPKSTEYAVDELLKKHQDYCKKRYLWKGALCGWIAFGVIHLTISLIFK
jgi:hypothetical protein